MCLHVYSVLLHTSTPPPAWNSQDNINNVNPNLDLATDTCSCHFNDTSNPNSTKVSASISISTSKSNQRQQDAGSGTQDQQQGRSHLKTEGLTIHFRMAQSLQGVWQGAAANPFMPIIGKDSQFSLGFSLLTIGILLCGYFGLSEYSQEDRRNAYVVLYLFFHRQIPSQRPTRWNPS